MTSKLLPVALLTGATAISGWVNAAPITFSSALPVDEGGIVFHQQFHYMSSGDDPSSANRDMTAKAAVSVLGYGVNEKLTLVGMLPYVDKSLEMRDAGIKRNNQGLGDLAAFVRYTVWQQNAQSRTFRVSGFGGLTAPTGDNDTSDRLGRLPPSLQTGTGTWNWFGGAVATYQVLDFEVDAAISYHNNRAANELEVGDELRLDLSGQYRLWPRELSDGVPSFVYGVLELNTHHQDRNRINGVSNDNSGGTTVWLSPGVQYVTKRWVWEAAVQKPITQDLHGSALEEESIIAAGVRVRF